MLPNNTNNTEEKHFLLPKDGYAQIEDKLIKIKSWEGVIDCSSGDGTLTFELENGEFLCYSDYDYKTTEVNIYKNLYNFNEGTIEEYTNYIGSNIAQVCYKNDYYKFYNKEGKRTGVRIQDNQLVEVELAKEKYRLENKEGRLIITPINENPVYCNREEAMLFYDYFEITEEGTTEHASLNTIMKFTKEQEEVIEKLQSIFAECALNNIILVHNVDTDSLKAYNITDVEYSIDYENETDMSKLGKDISRNIWYLGGDDKINFKEKE